jgi:hypothetical protein
MSVYRNGRYYIGSLSFAQPEIMAHVENGLPNNISCFFIDDYDVKFAVFPKGYEYCSDEQVFHFEDGKTDLTITIKKVS